MKNTIQQFIDQGAKDVLKELDGEIPYNVSEMIKAKDCKCVDCGKKAVCFWPIIDPDINKYPYCRKCVEKRKLELLLKLNE